MQKSQRLKEIADKHHEREKQDWGRFRAAFQEEWTEYLTANHVISSLQSCDDIIQQVHCVGPFLLELFRFDPTVRDVLDKPLGRTNSLVLWARRRLRSKFHLFITVQRQFGFQSNWEGQGHAAMTSDEPLLSEGALFDAVRMACGVDYVVTLSSEGAGASVYGLHFQAMPRLLDLTGQCYDLFGWLDRYAYKRTGNSLIRLEDYPAVCIRISGDQRYVHRNTWRLAVEYHNLTHYNLILRAIDPQNLTAYFFPRPLLTDWEGPQAVAEYGWAFGAFEMGGFFLVEKDELFQKILRDGTGGQRALNEYLRESSISEGGDEAKRLEEVISRLHA